MKKRTTGIILLVLGVMAVFGSIVNETFAGYANGVCVLKLTTITLTIGMIVGGVALIKKDKK